ncbi:MAG: class II aldolase/adducin family protein, partial [Rectinemataceae bacterium]|nr:class II aldolase/adducin family protein [Rectinemataceae bacterium]
FICSQDSGTTELIMIDTIRNASLALLATLSRRYGGDPDWVLAGGGNTSWKTADRLYVKASGFALASIDESGFCEMDRARLDAIWDKTYPADSAAREKAALADLMAARVPGETKRPSVETLLHGFFPQAFVVHTHPAIVNGLTCGREGEAAFRRLFGGEGIWVPLVDPGYILAKTVSGIFAEFKRLKGRAPAFMFMQNHGLLVAGGSPEEVEVLSDSIIAKLKAEIAGAGQGAGAANAEPDERAVTSDAGAIAVFQAALRALAGAEAAILHRADRMILGFAASAAAFAPLSRPFSPDHIVYAGHEYLRVDVVEDLVDAWVDYLKRNGKAPRIVLVRDCGVFAVGQGSREAAFLAASRALELFVDSCKVAVYSLAFGGPRPMSPESVAFIRNWEVEQYRASLSVP